MSFANCDAAYAAGRADIPRGDAMYAAKLDRDDDGIACETANAPAGFKPAPAAVEQASVQDIGRLPQTGPGEVTAIGGGLLLLGAVIAVGVRRRRVRFSA